MNAEELREIRELADRGMSLRAIARRLGKNVKTIRRAMKRPSKSPTPSRLEPFADLVREKAEAGLHAPRILREIRERGYTGSLTILKDLLRTIRGPQKPSRKVFRRFETGPGKEGQVDWSPYRVLLAGRQTVVHCFSMIAACARKQFIEFHRNERLPTLLHAHTVAFRFFGGCFRTNIYDNMATVTLGRVAGKPLWNPTFLEFSRHYGFTPQVCRPRHPDRKGKVEKPFAWIDSDLLRANSFSSWDDLNEKARHWLATVANCRVHPTTRRVPDEMFEEERPFLIRLPEVPYPTDRRETRKVQQDGYVPIDGSLYPAPARLVGQHVPVRIYPHHVEITDADGTVAASHAIPDRPKRIPTPREMFDRAEPSVSLSALETRFLVRFPQMEDFLDGLKRRMNALAPIHLHKIEHLLRFYPETAVRNAVQRAMDYRNFNAVAIERILRASCPDVVAEPPPEPIVPNPAALGALDDVDPGSPEDYTFDTEEPTQGEQDDAAQEKPE